MQTPTTLKKKTKTAQKYRAEWEQTHDKQKFIKLLLQKYHNLTFRTAERRYYDVRDTPNVADGHSTMHPIVHTTPPPSYFYQLDPKDVDVPDKMKQLMIEDMKRYNTKFTIEGLKKFGFTPAEIQWLLNNKKIELQG